MAIHRWRIASRRALYAVDALIGVWTAAWVVVGIWVAIDVHRLSRLSDTLATSAGALKQTSQGLAKFGHLPFVGAGIGSIAAKIAATAHSAATNAALSKADIGQLAYLLGIVIVIIPAVPALAAYLPFRVGRFREIRAVSKALGASEDLGQLERHLAGRALVNLSFHQLARISSQPLRDFEEGRVSRLAHAELARLGLDPSLLSPAGRVSEQDKS